MRRKSILIPCIKWIKYGRAYLDALLFPPRCPVCDEILHPEEIEKRIHPACESRLYPVKGAVCMHCGRPFGHIKSQTNPSKETYIPDFFKIESIYEYCRECQRKGYVKKSNITQGKSLYLYKGAVKKSMYRLKYANRREYADFFAKKAKNLHGFWLQTIQPQVIVPVPMYAKKQRRRGYNQAESFAAALSRETGIPMDKKLVQRVKDTAPQKELTDKERKNNLENAFQKQKSIVQYKKILIVDDIYTTGYTAEAVAKEIKQQSACEVYVLSICIGEDG